jgi:hypothetical protein
VADTRQVPYHCRLFYLKVYTMKRLSHLVLGIITVGVLTTGLLIAQPAISERLGIDFWNLPSLYDEIREQLDKDQELSAQDEVVMRRIRIKDTIIRDLLDGRTSLFEAAAEFRELSKANAHYEELLRLRFPNRSLNEIYCLNVIEFVEVQIEHLPSATPEIVQYLRDQLANHKHRNGGQVILP